MGKWWRVFGTGLCFALYGALSWIAGFTLLPLLLAWPGTAAARECRVRRLVSASFRCLLAVAAALRLGHVEIEGREWLARADGKLVVATHPMYLDVVALVALLPQADCVIKQAMWRNPLYRRFVRSLGYIGNASSAGLMEDCAESLRRGRTLILFPEGTRSTPGTPLRFRRGAAQVAVRSQCDILPVMIRCEPAALGKRSAWYQVPGRRWRLSIKVLPPQPLSAFGYREDMPHGVAARRITRAMENFFTQHLATHEYTDRRIEAAHHRLARS